MERGSVSPATLRPLAAQADYFSGERELRQARPSLLEVLEEDRPREEAITRDVEEGLDLPDVDGPGDRTLSFVWIAMCRSTLMSQVCPLRLIKVVESTVRKYRSAFFHIVSWFRCRYSETMHAPFFSSACAYRNNVDMGWIA